LNTTAIIWIPVASLLMQVVSVIVAIVWASARFRATSMEVRQTISDNFEALHRDFERMEQRQFDQAKDIAALNERTRRLEKDNNV
jgi:hypothetical protein